LKACSRIDIFFMGGVTLAKRVSSEYAHPRYDKRAHTPYHPNVRPRLSASVIFILAMFSASAQNTSVLAVLTNAGQPMRVGYECAEEDLQWVGMSCTEDEPCPIYVELNAVASNGTKILVAGNLHSTSGTQFPPSAERRFGSYVEGTGYPFQG